MENKAVACFQGGSDLITSATIVCISLKPIAVVFGDAQRQATLWNNISLSTTRWFSTFIKSFLLHQKCVG